MSEAVYQPTTVTYKANHDENNWQDRPISYLQSVTQTVRRPCGLQCLNNRNIVSVILISSSITCFCLGLVLLIHGAIGYSDTTPETEDVFLAVTIVGAIFFAFSILLFALFLRLTRRICWRNVKDHMSSRNTMTGQSLTVNPSTDLLVAAQYAPVSEVAYQPNHLVEDTSEQSKLMANEHKDIHNEDTDRMIESDPRILLRPLNPTSNSTANPNAAHEKT